MSGVLAMGINRITNVAYPTGTQDSATKSYVDIPKLFITSGAIQNSIGSDIMLYTPPAGETVDNAKIWVIQLWVERNAHEWFDGQSGGVKSLWSHFHVFTGGPSTMTYFSSSQLVVGCVTIVYILWSFSNETEIS